jgi:hypothetical protein
LYDIEDQLSLLEKYLSGHGCELFLILILLYNISFIFGLLIRKATIALDIDLNGFATLIEVTNFTIKQLNGLVNSRLGHLCWRDNLAKNLAL